MEKQTFDQLERAAWDWNVYHHVRELTVVGIIVYPFLLPLIGAAVGYVLNTRLGIEPALAYGLMAALVIPLITWRVGSGLKKLGDASRQKNSHDRALVDSIDRTARRIADSAPAENPKGVYFETLYKTYNDMVTKLYWKGEIEGETLILVRLPRNEIYFLKRRQFNVERTGDKSGLLVKFYPCRVSFALRKDPARVPISSYEKLLKWKRGV